MSHVKTAVMVLVISMVLSLVLAYASIMTIVQTTKSNTERVLNSFVIETSTYIYNSIKNGNDFTTAINANYFVSQFSLENSLDFDGNFLYNKNDRGVSIFKMTNPTTRFSVDNTLNLITTFDLLIPVQFAGKQVTEMRIPIKVTASYILKN